MLFQKIIIQTFKIIKNTTLHIKIIFKIYLKNIKNKLKIFHVIKQIFVLQNIIKQFLKIVLKNYYS